MNIRRSPFRIRGGFTLAEVAIATGIAAGVLAILTMLMGALSRDVRRLKPYEAWRRPAFDGKAGSSSSSSTTPGNTNDPNTNGDSTSSTSTTQPTHTLPDANLNPASRPDENSVPPDPDDPGAKKPEDGGNSNDNSNTSGTNTSSP